jgi:hypothetical protein
MKKILSIFIAVIAAQSMFGQAAYVLPSPTGADEPLTIYIDVSQTTYTGLKDRLIAYPEAINDVYIWTWQPADNGGNGQWSSSAEGRKMTHVSGLLFKYEIIPTEFYGVTGPQLFARGISCLAKLKDGTAYPDIPLEAKTEDLSITIIPKLCDDRFCIFPEIGKAEDFISITYNNNLELDANLQGLGADECYIYLVARGNSAFNIYPYVPVAQVTSTPALKMKPVPGKPGEFRLTIIPEDFFGTIIPATQTFRELRYYIVKPGYTPPSPVFEAFTFLQCVD